LALGQGRCREGEECLRDNRDERGWVEGGGWRWGSSGRVGVGDHDAPGGGRVWPVRNQEWQMKLLCGVGGRAEGGGVASRTMTGGVGGAVVSGGGEGGGRGAGVRPVAMGVPVWCGGRVAQGGAGRGGVTLRARAEGGTASGAWPGVR